MVNLPACLLGRAGRRFIKTGVVSFSACFHHFQCFCHRCYATFILISQWKPKAWRRFVPSTPSRFQHCRDLKHGTRFVKTLWQTFFFFFFLCPYVCLCTWWRLSCYSEHKEADCVSLVKSLLCCQRCGCRWKHLTSLCVYYSQTQWMFSLLCYVHFFLHVT